MAKFIRNNSLLLGFIMLLLLAFSGQWLTGFLEYRRQQNQDGRPAISLLEYSYFSQFLQSTFEKRESEFLQMALFVVLTISF